MLYGKEVLVGQDLEAPLSALSAVAHPASGERGKRDLRPQGAMPSEEQLWRGQVWGWTGQTTVGMW